jgi:hypothetical protein
VKELADKAETATHGVIEWAGTVTHELDKAVDSVEQAVSVGLTTLVADWRREMEATVTRLVDYLEKEWPEAVTTKEADWRQKVDTVRALLAHTFESMAEHDQKVKDYAEERWLELKDEQLKSTQEVARTLAEEISSLDQTVDNYQGQVQVAAEMVAAQQEQAATAASQLGEGLVDLRGCWATFGINC